jgi:hypothetical protein
MGGDLDFRHGQVSPERFEASLSQVSKRRVGARLVIGVYLIIVAVASLTTAARHGEEAGLFVATAGVLALGLAAIALGWRVFRLHRSLFPPKPQTPPRGRPPAPPRPRNGGTCPTCGFSTTREGRDE